MLKKMVVWLLAAMLSHLPAISARCACADEAEQGVCCASRRQASSEAPRNRGCCSPRAPERKTRTCCGGRQGHLQNQAATEPAEGCKCVSSCVCSRESTPAAPIFPPTGRNTLADQLALVPADSLAESASEGELSRSTFHRRGDRVAPATSLQRCIILSRFTL